MSLPTRKIGNDSVAAMGFGLMGLSIESYGGTLDSEKERFKVLDAAVDMGSTNWDTADVYMDSEGFVGRWLKKSGRRNELFIATKFGITAAGVNGTPEYVKQAAASSVSRLGIDTIDLFYLHRADPKTPIEITVGAMAELVKEGKVRYLGLSEVSATTLRRAHAVHPIAAVQVEYSPFCLDIEDEKIGLLKACRELGVAVVAYSPLGRGMLTGTYKSNADIPDTDWRKKVPRLSQENFPNILKLVGVLEKIAKNHSATSGQITLAWLLAQGSDIIPIPGTRKIKYLKENAEAVKIKLSPDEIAEIRDISAIVDAAGGGDRYPDKSSMQLLFADTPEL
ncbi:Aldo/keto reductase [Agrocybe pediades]|nr:Aldo/keto reductase [Agrocybe pediades]